MFEIPPSNLHMRSCTDPSALQSQLKRQKPTHLTNGSPPPPAFWDSLSKIWLTKSALRELNRRNSPPYSQHQAGRRPVTRKIVAQLKRNSRVTQSAVDFLHHCEPRTLLDVKRFSRNGGPDLSDLKGVSMTRYLPSVGADDAVKFPEPVNPFRHTMSLSESRSRGRKRGLASTINTRPTTSNTKTTESSGPYSPNFEQKLIDGGIYPHRYKYPDGRVPPKPDNLDEINQRLTQYRSSISPSRFPNEKFEEFQDADAHVSKENKVTKTMMPIIEGKIIDEKCVEGDILFTNLTPIIQDPLTAAKPDLYYGTRPEQLDRQIRDKLRGHIIPSTQDELPIVPNFFLAAKGPNGTSAAARRQACYDGALGARGIHTLQSYGKDETIYDNKAYTITSIYNDDQLKLYTNHPIQPTSLGGQPEYFMNQLNAWGMTGNADTFRQGVTAYRNARDWTKEQRDEAIKQANEISNRDSGSTTGASMDETNTIEARVSNTSAEPAESETSTDELARDYEVRIKRVRKAV